MKTSEKTRAPSEAMLSAQGYAEVSSTDDVLLSDLCQWLCPRMYQYRCLSQFAMLYQCCHVSCSPISVFIRFCAHRP